TSINRPFLFKTDLKKSLTHFGALRAASRNHVLLADNRCQELIFYLDEAFETKGRLWEEKIVQRDALKVFQGAVVKAEQIAFPPALGIGFEENLMLGLASPPVCVPFQVEFGGVEQQTLFRGPGSENGRFRWPQETGKPQVGLA